MNRYACAATALFLSTFLTAQDAKASFRCSGGLVSNGDSFADVEHKCGRPDYQRVIEPATNTTPNRAYPVARTVYWYYGPRNGAVTQITFGTNKVAVIRTYKPMSNSEEDLYKQTP
ncbi:DUF2845 domain-containing protein [Pseudomonas panipatensis]|uniref:DUF2845 domain-containing protein n=1 Tax=Pseudomonas panipatensis TaxID=428992 RepID=UPI000B7FBB51